MSQVLVCPLCESPLVETSKETFICVQCPDKNKKRVIVVVRELHEDHK